MKYNFNVVQIMTEKSGNCPVCGKRAVRKKTFWQSVNPWNQNGNGFPKTKDEIYDEIKKEALEWRKEPVCHAKCEKEKE